MADVNKSSESTNTNLASLILRLGLAFVFLYASVSAFRSPDAWLGYVPNFVVNHLMAAKTALDLTAAFQIVLAAVLLSGKYIKYVALVSAAMLTGIVLINLGTLLITFRDIGLIFMSLALAALENNN